MPRENLPMPRTPRLGASERRLHSLAAKLETIARLSPTAGALFQDWIDRLIAGESIETVQPEMDRFLEVWNKARRRR
jgi:hypothetical protein